MNSRASYQVNGKQMNEIRLVSFLMMKRRARLSFALDTLNQLAEPSSAEGKRTWNSIHVKISTSTSISLESRSRHVRYITFDLFDLILLNIIAISDFCSQISLTFVRQLSNGAIRPKIWW